MRPDDLKTATPSNESERASLAFSFLGIVLVLLLPTGLLEVWLLRLFCFLGAI